MNYEFTDEEIDDLNNEIKDEVMEDYFMSEDY